MREYQCVSVLVVSMLVCFRSLYRFRLCKGETKQMRSGLAHESHLKTGTLF